MIPVRTAALVVPALAAVAVAGLVGRPVEPRLAAAAERGEPRASESRVVGTLFVEPCEAMAAPGAQAWCGTLDRPWDPGRPARGSVPLAFAVLLPTAGPPAAPAVVGLEGGPGYGGIDSGQAYADMLGPLTRDRALVVMDARGTGRSGAVDCPRLQVGRDGVPAVRGCAERLGERSGLYGSALAADDLAALVEALGLGDVDVYGDSYGTYLAQVFAGRHPDRVRSLVLDGAYPVVGESAWYPTQGPALRSSLRKLCERTPSCARLPGTTRGRLADVLDRLRQAPVSVVAPGGDARRHRLRLEPSLLVGVAFNATYVPTTYRELDAALRAALVGDWLPLGRLAAEYLHPTRWTVSPPRAYSVGQQYAVSCHDYPQLFSADATLPARRAQVADAAARAQRETPRLYAPFTITDYLASDWSEIDDCLGWPSRPVDPSRQPGPPGGTYPDVPTLVLSGEFDTITSPAQGALVAAQFPRSRQVVVRDGLHVVAMGDGGGCASALVRDFLRDSAAVLARPTITCAAAPIRLAAGYPETARGLAVPWAVLQTAADALDRLWQTDMSRGLGLRGGAWRYRGWPDVRLTLSGYALVGGLPVDGVIRWNADSGSVTARLVAAGQRWVATWNTVAASSTARLTRLDAPGSVSYPAP